ncbi:MAG TPA: FtsX-like permease family protein, partial [Actinomycetota bacterium]|nr:FtsX-like permease family protein [Actinomycetota bacterium]
GQAIGRQIRSGAADRAVLRALGAPPTVTMADALTTPLPAILAGSVLAGALAVALSPVAPLGVVRAVYPFTGFAVDWTALGAGIGLLVVALGGWSLVAAWRWAPQRTRPTSPPASSARALQALGAPRLGPSAAVGIRFAFDSGAAGSGMPSRSAMLGAALAVGAMVVTLTFGSGLATLVSTPAYYGWNWSYLLDSSNNVPPQALAQLAKDPLVAGWAGIDDSQLSIDGQIIPVETFDTTATVRAPLLSGHWMTDPYQILLGPTTMANLGKHLGDTVVVSYGSPQDAPLDVPPTRVTIVGTATMPAIGYVSQAADHASMGSGAIVASGFPGVVGLEGGNNTDPTLNGPNTVAVQLRPGVSAAAGRANMQRVADAANAAFAADPNGIGNTVFVLAVQRPAQIVNFRSMGSTPALLAGGLALGAVVALGLTLASSVRRRRRDLALLKTLGFTTRQVGGAVAWQASVAALVGVVVGIPLGIAAGRQLWILFARSIAAVPHPTVPVLAVAGVGAGALVFANVVAALPARAAARTPAAEVLRSE